MDVSVFIERGFAIGYMACGASLLFNTENWLFVIQDFEKSKTSKVLAGFVAVFLGSFMVAGHNIWEDSPRLLTTIIAWLALIEGVVYLTYPKVLTQFIPWFSSLTFLRFAGVFAVGLSVFILKFSF